MARERAPEVAAIQQEKAQIAVRLELPLADDRRLERQASKLELTKALGTVRPGTIGWGSPAK